MWIAIQAKSLQIIHNVILIKEIKQNKKDEKKKVHAKGDEF